MANDTSVLLGRLDLKLFAGAEPDNAKAAVRLASDMGEFFMPYPGTRINQQTFPLDANGMTGSASSYEVKFTDTTKPNGQIWAGVVGNANVTHRADSATSAGSWSGWAPTRTRSTPTPLSRWPIRSDRGAHPTTPGPAPDPKRRPHHPWIRMPAAPAPHRAGARRRSGAGRDAGSRDDAA